MKFVVAIIVVFSFVCIGSKVSAIDEGVLVNFVRGVIKECQTKLQTPDAVLEEIVLPEFGKGGADRVAMCHINCMMEKFGFLKKGNIEAFKSFHSSIDEEEAKKALEICQLETGVDDCETGYKIHICLKDKSDKIYNA